jgi:hypothetical protein
MLDVGVIVSSVLTSYSIPWKSSYLLYGDHGRRNKKLFHSPSTQLKDSLTFAFYNND